MKLVRNWVKLKSSEFYNRVMNSVTSVVPLYTEIGNFSYYYNNISSNESLLYIEWVDTHVNIIKKSDMVDIWKYSNIYIKHSKFISKTELSEHFNILLRKDKLERLRDKINENHLD
jgi:hypothetical protein